MINYINTINDNLKLNPNEWYFKNDKHYNVLLEHLSEAQGYDYLQQINLEFNDIFNNNLDFFINLCNINDTYGKTIKIDFKNFCICSPSNLRYIYHSLIILSHIKKLNINNIDIIEIGGGYGGLCFYINKLSYFFNINIKSYIIFDVLSASILQKKYLNLLNINNVKTYYLDENFELNTNSYLISNYAYSEINKSLQNEYTNKVLNKYIEHGFLVWNFGNFYNFINNKTFNIEQEKPLTASDNLFVYF